MSEEINITQAAQLLNTSRVVVYQALDDGRLTWPITRAQIKTYQPGKVGRKPKYTSEEERKEHRRRYHQQRYQARKQQ